ncbi:MAG: alpha-hydroxy-acid oxidizing protein [Xanthobacteraceae bacterium]|jgi:L-lactate dehydrogenase (cytochrome)|nr:alpha-hydroxy-acid oxidizing protein [Xanthobacteraceae bacterium]
MQTITCVEDLREVYKQRVPKMFIDYAESGSYSEQTLRWNREDLQKIRLKQKILTDVSKRDTKTTIAGKQVNVPLILAPIGLCGMQRANGEILAARAADEAGIPFTLSTMSVCSIEDVASETKKPFWFQLYVMKDREFIRNLIARAAAAKCSALVLTVDLQILAQRHRDIKNGLSVPPKLKIASVLDMLTKPRWLGGILGTRRRSFGNLVGHVKGMTNTGSLGEWTASQFDPALNWEDVKWIRKLWKGKLIIKGIMEVSDAKLALKHGADGIVVSNHGGRQLDGAPSSISALPKIVDAIGDKTEVLFDGGIRTGQDLMRALALGAKGAMIGRAFVYGLGANGQEGVRTAIECIRKELDMSMALCGVNKISEIDERVLAD